MGLDVFELVMRIEEEFELQIPDEDAGELLTARQVIDYLMSKREIKERNLTRADIQKEVWFMIEEELGIDRTNFNEDSDFYRDMGAG